MYANCGNVTYFNSFAVEYIPKYIKKSKLTNISQQIFYRIQSNNSIMCGYFCIAFIDFDIHWQKLDYTKNFSPNKHDKNDI